MSFAVRALRKSFGSVAVLKGVDLSVDNGEIHALLGANGAGKSTLIKCISGAEAPTSGSIVIDDVEYKSLDPRSAIKEGVAVIYQAPSVALSLDVSENVFLGHEPSWGPIRTVSRMRRQTSDLLRSLGSDIGANADLATLGNADLQVIEIAKALARDPKVLILDEPTAALTEREVAQLAIQMRALRARGLPLLFITHRLSEAMELADRVSVLRGGEVVLTGRTSELTKGDLIDAIVGSSISTERRVDARQTRRPALLQARGLVSAGLGPIDVTADGGEVVGVYGLTGSGRTELLETMAGARRTVAGSVRIDARPIRCDSPRATLAHGIALVPSDRLRKSIFSDLTASINMLLPRIGEIARLGVFRHRHDEERIFDHSARALHLQPHDSSLEATRFSGGNQQKLVLSRWLNGVGECSLLLLDEPTDGVDVGARSDLYEAIRDFVSDGTAAVLIASSEPEELIRIAHRVIVLSRGVIAGELVGDDITEHRLLELAHAGEVLRDGIEMDEVL